MCGIVGEVTFDNRNLSEAWVREACQIMQHRGPDGTGFYSSGGVALGHRRLSIIDLSGGSQPMSYADGRYWITFNGEIYNYKSLKSELTSCGFEFKTNSDTEVILAAYCAWGVKAMTRLNGIFALAIWDCETHDLLLARDHLGIKPLLYRTGNGGLQFASELKPLLSYEGSKNEVDLEALQDYLTLGYVLTPRTMIKGIQKLPAGHYLYVHNGHVTVHNYWDLASLAQNGTAPRKHESDYLEEFAALLNDSVRSQMVSDVPLGTFLSGGIDSSAVSAFASRASNDTLKTFSIGFNEESFSELNFAKLASEHLKTDHHQQVVTPLSLDELAKLAWYYDEPLADTSTTATYFVSKLAREHVTVSLSGDGGDEILAGYDTYLADRFQALYRYIPRWVHRNIAVPAASWIPSSYKKVSIDFMIKQFIAQASNSPEMAHFGWRRMFEDEDIALLTGHASAGYSSFNSYSQYYDAVEDASPLLRSQYVDIKTWLVDDILAKVDRASMASGLEARVPFLSPRVVEYSLQLPDALKLRGFQTKHILKQAMRRYLPEPIINRKKRGFNTPVSIWMRNILRDGVSSLINDGQSSLINLKSPMVQKLWGEHVSGKLDHGFKLWTLLSLVLWEQQVLSATQLQR